MHPGVLDYPTTSMQGVQVYLISAHLASPYILTLSDVQRTKQSTLVKMLTVTS